MNDNVKKLIDTLEKTHSLSLEEYRFLIENISEQSMEYAREKAVAVRQSIYGNTVFIRGLIEIGNVCRNDCYYCGIRKSNKNCDRYRLTEDQILECCREGYPLGFRTFVMQGGEDGSFAAEKVCSIVKKIKSEFPDCAVTLSLGEYSKEDYTAMFASGADRYLLRHETANKEHYEKLHPSGMSFENRMECLYNLKQIGFQTGCGFMVGSPLQTSQTLAEDLKFIETFSPEMCGIGPYLPHKDTPFFDKPAGSVDLTVYLLSLIKLIKPNILLPSTTALASIEKNGRERGILAGANVVMPNLSPFSERKKYTLYDGKAFSGSESAQSLIELKEKMAAIGYEVVTARGDISE